MRVGGRLRRANNLEFETKHQIILPYRSHLTDLIIRHFHENEVGHLGANAVLSAVRRTFWVVKGKAAVRRVLSSCMVCKRRRASSCEQFMADLPAARVTPEKPPFSQIGVDYFGPLLVKVGRKTVKRYGCLFTCLASRAVHIEISNSLEQDSFIAALQRFSCRRGQPETIYSDNGTNFRGGERELRESLKEWNQHKIARTLHQKGIKWYFNPPTASHMGGVWERIIKSTKQILKTLLNEQLVNEEVLRTVMAEVERILNDRPLTGHSDSPDDLSPLTPNKLLLLRSNSCLPPGVFVKEDLYSRRWWRQAQYLADVFWRRWISEYLPTLQVRQKWHKKNRNLQNNDLVLIVDERLPRGQWPLGLVVEALPDSEGLVRAVKVRSAGSIKTRPIHKLCLLEHNQEYSDISTKDN